MKLKLVVIGCGWAGKFHATGIQRDPNAELVAVVDKDLDRAKSFSDIFKVPYYHSIAQLLRDKNDEFDGACICTLPSTHFELCKKLIEKGKHVFCEKPLERNVERIEQLMEIADKAAVKFGVNHNQRFAPTIVEAQKLISRDSRVHMIQASMQQNGPKDASDLVNDYFLLTDSCCHLFDTLFFLNGNISKVQAFGKRLNSNILSDITVNMEFLNGSIGTLMHTFVGGIHESQHPFQRFEVTTSEARYTIENMYDGLHVYPHKELYRKVWEPSVFEARDYSDSMITSVQAWIKSVVKSSAIPVGLEEARKNTLVIQACIQSLETGEIVEVQY